MTKIAGSGSISQRHGSEDPDPELPQNVMDPQHWFHLCSKSVIFSGEVAAGIAALVLKNNLEEIIEDKMKHGMVSYGRKKNRFFDLMGLSHEMD